MPRYTGPSLHVVVFDVNVYLDAAQLVGEPFSWSRFQALAVKYANTVVPADDARIDSLRALSLCTSDRFAGSQPLEVWTSNHIDALVVRKARQPITGAKPEDRGLGWESHHAEDLLEELVYGLVYRPIAGGGSVGDLTIPAGTPPLSHEDGMVYRTAKVASDRENTIGYCVTRDKEFRMRAPHSDIITLYPQEWIHLVRRSRFAVSTAVMKPPTGR